MSLASRDLQGSTAVTPGTPLEPRIVGRPDGTYQVIFGDRVLASCDSYMEAAEWIEDSYDV